MSTINHDFRRWVVDAYYEERWPRFLWRWFYSATEGWGEPSPSQQDRRIAEYFANLPIGEHTIIIAAPSMLGVAALKAEGGLNWNLPNGRMLTVIPDLKSTCPTAAVRVSDET